MKRREFIKASGKASIGIVIGQSLLGGLSARAASKLTGLPLQSLISNMATTDGTIYLPSNANYAAYNTAFNKRTQLAPQVRALVTTSTGVQTALQWAMSNNVPFAVRCGGHSYEGYSQSRGLVIDVRMLAQVDVDATANQVVVGSGAALGDVYTALAPHKMAIPAGSCFHVGVSGHALGGGFGLLARPFGLACDSITSLKVVTASGALVTASDTENTDLFWAMRGGGNGNFGIVTEFEFKMHNVDTVADFDMAWEVTIESAVGVMRAWQTWLQSLPKPITCVFHISKASAEMIHLKMSGQAVMSIGQLMPELKALESATGPILNLRTSERTFLESALYFAGGRKAYDSILMKAKSDYLTQPMSDAGIKVLMKTLAANTGQPVTVICDSYGGAINEKHSEDTAFVHRGSTLYSMQYYMEWSNPSDSTANLATMRKIYAAMRPYVSGGAYVNYCDLDLTNGPKAYWGDNLPRLMSLKKQFDPKNIFSHAQGVPLASR